MPLRNWAANITFSTAVLHRPTSVDELQELVSRSRRIRALGSGHSFNRIADTTGELVSTRAIRGSLTFAPDHTSVEVPAGRSYGEITSELSAAGYALHNLGSLPHISVAGACATGTHGSGNGNGNLATAVDAVEFVRSDGELVQVCRTADASPTGDPDDFGGSVLALGALGVVTRLRLRIEPAFEVRQDVWCDMPIGALAEHIDEVMAAGYSVSVFTDWRHPDVADKVWVKRRTDRPGHDWLPVDWHGARLATGPMHPITGEDVAAATPQLGQPGPWHARLPHFRHEFTPSSGREIQSEYLLPRAHAADAVRALRAMAPVLGEPLLVCELRTVAADDLWLSPSHERASFAVHLTWVDDLDRVRPVVSALEAALAPFAPRPHWAKLFTTAPEEIAALYPRRPDFIRLAERHDPEGKFANDFLDTHVLRGMRVNDGGGRSRPA